MALSDILKAIVEETDSRISEARSEHKKRVKELRERSETEILDIQRSIENQKKQKMAALKSRAESHVEMRARHLSLEEKRKVLDEAYALLLEKLAALPAKEQKAFLERCLKSIPEKGTLHPAPAHKKLLEELADEKKFTIGKPTQASGGFLFSSETQNRDYTYEFLAQHVLRPTTEVSAAHRLFS